MDEAKIKELLAYEIENKKGYRASYDITCNICDNTISEGEEFIFLGEKQKVCGECIGEINKFLGV